MGVRTKVSEIRRFFEENPDRAVGPDSPAHAVMGFGLRCVVTGPNGGEMITAVDHGLGGDSSAPSAGWYHRAALAACIATQIGLRAGEREIEFEELEVTVESWSDARGMLGLESSSAQPIEAKVTIKIASRGSTTAELRSIADWATSTSSVTATYRENIRLDVNLDIDTNERASRLSRRFTRSS